MADRTSTPGEATGVIRRRDELGIAPWDVLILVATVVIAVVVPVDLVLGPFDGFVPIASALVAGLFAVDILQRFSRPITVHGMPVSDPAALRDRYLRTWFAVDLAAAIPFDLIARLPGAEGSSLGDVLRILGLLRVIRVVRFVALQREWRVRASFNPAVMRLSFFAFWILLLAHWIACGWIQINSATTTHPFLEPYQEGLYWTITTLTTVGYGDTVPDRAGEVWFTMVVMALGAAMYGYIIGNVASLLANIDVLRAQHLSRLETINHFMRDRHVPRELQARVRDYYNYLWESRMARQSEMLADLPVPLRTEIALHLNRNVVRRVPIFQGADESFLRELVLNFEPTVAIPGENIVTRGGIGHRIYFINKGRVEVLAADEKTVVATLTDGNFFGEMALLTSQPRSNTVRALDYCNLYTLDRERFNRVLEDFPEFAAQVNQIAADRAAESRSQEG